MVSCKQAHKFEMREINECGGSMEYQEYLELVDKINYHMDLYYNQDAPEISDFDYDQLMLQLKKVEGEHPEWVKEDSPTRRIGGTTKREAGVEVTHNVPMLSIQDVFSKEEVEDWVKQVKALHKDAAFSVEEKIDGLSMTLRYQDGNLTLAETRGDGRVGEDVTLNALVIPDVKKKIAIQGYLELRGEVYMSHEDFERFNESQEKLGKKTAANPRNLAAGTLRQLDSGVVKERGLRMYVFNVQQASGNELEGMEHIQALTYLSNMGIYVVPHKQCREIGEIFDEIDSIGDRRGELPYDIDGAVVKLDQVAYRQDFPAGSKYSAGHIAYKYPPEEKEVEIEEIEVAVGRTGKMTFRARFKEPVRLCGTNVQRATLHNIDFIQNMGISPGCKAICRKQGEIIPAIIRVTKQSEASYEAPRNCPICGHTLMREEETCDIYCNNPSCPAQVKRTIAYFAGKGAMDIKNFGTVYVEQLVDLGYLKDMADIYTLKNHREELIEQGIMGKEKNTDKILQAIEDSKQNDAYMLLTGLAIRNVGKVSAKEIMKHFRDIWELSQASIDTLTNLPDVGEITASCIYNYFREAQNLEMLKKLNDSGVNLKALSQGDNTGALEGLTFVVTGTLPTLGRKEVGELIENNGGKNTGSVSKKTNYLVAGEAAGSKLAKAVELGIPVITEEELLRMIENTN